MYLPGSELSMDDMMDLHHYTGKSDFEKDLGKWNREAKKKSEKEEYSNKKGTIKQYIYKSRKCLNKKQYKEALEMVDLAISIGQNTIISARAYCMRSKIHYAQNNFNKAIQDIEKAIELNPKYDELFRIRAYFFVHEKRFDEAIKDCETVYELNKGKDYDILSEIGKIYYEKK
jgi:tetratricopeptide (TPR) repeat protein